MASEVTVLIGAGAREPERALELITPVFAQVEAECTRFDADSDLMRANRAGDEWCAVGPWCYAAIVEAAAAHLRTGGLFDPRILDVLQRLGYSRSLPFAGGAVEVNDSTAPPEPAAAPPPQWAPQFDPDAQAVRIGPVPIDLGGIGKGLAVRWAAEQLAPLYPEFVIDAGGDCALQGAGPDGDGWHVGIEDPRGGPHPVAVLALREGGCTTSSIRLRRWRAAGVPVHHLIDPRTGVPGGAGLLSVTVVGPDPAEDEVWSKVLFLQGRDAIAEVATDRGLAAIWVDEDGAVAMTEAARRFVIWRAAAEGSA
ncbi:MAG TPA: FAD:protein FMN transferase [Solirubrobacteraceae bacterium]|nr:FAD:protein FMN transferase [Solirubrobacteraceae bacterium]